MEKQYKDFRFTLRAARLINGMTQKYAAEALGITANTLSGYEKSERYPDVMMLKRMEQLYGVRYDQMIFPDLQ